MATWIRPSSGESPFRDATARGPPIRSRIGVSVDLAVGPMWMATRIVAGRSEGRLPTMIFSGPSAPAEPPITTTSRRCPSTKARPSRTMRKRLRDPKSLGLDQLPRPAEDQAHDLLVIQERARETELESRRVVELAHHLRAEGDVERSEVLFQLLRCACTEDGDDVHLAALRQRPRDADLGGRRLALARDV